MKDNVGQNYSQNAYNLQINCQINCQIYKIRKKKIYRCKYILCAKIHLWKCYVVSGGCCHWGMWRYKFRSWCNTFGDLWQKRCTGYLMFHSVEKMVVILDLMLFLELFTCKPDSLSSLTICRSLFTSCRGIHTNKCRHNPACAFAHTQPHTSLAHIVFT